MEKNQIMRNYSSCKNYCICGIHEAATMKYCGIITCELNIQIVYNKNKNKKEKLLRSAIFAKNLTKNFHEEKAL